MRNKKTFLTLVVVIVIVSIFAATTVLAGDPDSPGAPAVTSSYSLEDVYQRLSVGTAGSPSVFTEPSSAPGVGTMHSINEIMAVAPELDNTNGTTAANVLAGKTFWGLTSSQWATQTGTMPNNGAGSTIVPTTTNQSVAAGYWSSANTVQGDTDLAADNIKSGVNLFGVDGTLTAGGTVTTTYIPKTGQTISYATDDDGDLEKGATWPNPRFTDNNDGTVTDNLTGLMWMKGADVGDDCDGVDIGGETWAVAMASAATCNTNSVAGYTDWRLPNVRELHSLVDYGYTHPSVPNTAGTGQWTWGSPFTSVWSSNYWSSSTLADPTTVAWGMFLDFGNVGGTYKTGTAYVWPVRGGQ